MTTVPIRCNMTTTMGTITNTTTMVNTHTDPMNVLGRIALPLRMACVVLLASAASLVGAQHHHVPKHGGVVQEAEGHHIEMVISGDELKFYLSDSLGRSVPLTNASGTAYVRFDGNSSANVEMTVMKDGGLRAVLLNPAMFKLVASIKVDGRFISAPFMSGPRQEVPAAPARHGPDDGHGH